MTNVAAAPGMAVLATAVAFASLAILHVVSPEFQPSWRMVSEYANGHHRWLLSVMFAAWGLGSFALAMAHRWRSPAMAHSPSTSKAAMIMAAGSCSRPPAVQQRPDNSF